MRDEDILREFYSNKDSHLMSYNFDLKELMDNFTMLNFVKNGRKVCLSEEGVDFGGFFVCTPKQYVIGYNSNYGVGVTGKLKKSDPDNPSGEDDIVFLSIYDRDNNMFYDTEIKLPFDDRIDNKNEIIEIFIDNFLKIV